MPQAIAVLLGGIADGSGGGAAGAGDAATPDPDADGHLRHSGTDLPVRLRTGVTNAAPRMEYQATSRFGNTWFLTAET